MTTHTGARMKDTMRRLIFLTATCLLSAGCSSRDLDQQDLADQVHAMVMRTELRMSGHDPGDLRPEAVAILKHLREHGWDMPLPGEINQLAFANPPKTIKLWRRSMTSNPGTAKSCDPGNKIQVIPMEDYVKGVLPHEWILSWHSESLKAGAVAIRTYASYWVSKGGKYTCADLCDMAYSQVYKDSKKTKTNQAVDATKGQLMIKGGKLACTEYSAKNTQYPTWGGVKVDDTKTCAGETKYGHGRGMCQWGSSRWASQQGKGYNWMVHHYYPGATLWSPSTTPDKGVPPKLDQGLPPKLDQGLPPKLDQGVPPKLDQGVPPKLDQGVPPKLDKGTPPPPKKDKGRPPPPPRLDGGPLPPAYQNNALTLQGGCNLGDAGSGAGVLSLGLLLLVMVRRRR